MTEPQDQLPAPPVPDGDNVERLRHYFAQHRDRYTPDALGRAATAAGYRESDVSAALTASAGDDGRSDSGRFANVARLIVLALYAGTFLLLVAPTDMGERTYQVGPLILAAMLVITGLISLWLVGRRRQVSADPLAALAVMLAAPFVLLVVVAGLCIWTTAPSFVPGGV